MVVKSLKIAREGEEYVCEGRGCGRETKHAYLVKGQVLCLSCWMSGVNERKKR